MHRRVEFIEGASSKFWEVEVSGSDVTTRWGRIGTAGQEKSKGYSSEDAALKDAEAQLQGKLKKGYTEVTPEGAAAAPKAPPPPPSPKPKAAAEPVVVAEPVREPEPEPQPEPAASPALPEPEPAPQPQPLVARSATLVGKAFPTRQAAWTGRLASPDSLLKSLADGFKYSDQWRTGLGLCVPRVEAALRRCLEALETRKLGSDWSSDAPVWLALFGVGDNPPARSATVAVEFVLASLGPVATIEALLQSRKLHRNLVSDDYHWISRVQRKRASYYREWLAPWVPLRQVVSQLEEAEYAAIRDFAIELMGRLEIDERALVAFLFPDEESIWRPLAAEIIQNTSLQYGMWSSPDRSFALLACSRDPILTLQLMQGPSGQGVSHHLTQLEPALGWSLVERLGVESAPHLLSLARCNVDLGAPLMALESAELAQSLKAFLEERQLRALALEYYQTYPRLGVAALAQVVAGGGKNAELARPALMALLVAQPELVETLSGRERSCCESLLARRVTQAAVAAPEQLPRLLVTPPWKVKNEPRKPLVVEVEGPRSDDRIVWGRSRPKAYCYDVPPPAGADDRALRELEIDIKKRELLHAWRLDAVSDENALRLWNSVHPQQWVSWAAEEACLMLLSRFELAALEGILNLAYFELNAAIPALELVDSPRVAPCMAQASLRLQRRAKAARLWLQRYPRAAACGLLKQTVGPLGKARDEGEAAFRYLAKLGHGELLLEVAREAGVEEAVREVLEFDPLRLVPARLPKLPGFAQIDGLPLLFLRGRSHTLPKDSAEFVVQMLSFTSFDAPYAGIDVVRDALDGESLEEFAWELFSQWLSAGAPAKEKWAFLALGLFGGDESARRLVPLIRAWPQEGGFARAEIGLDVLCSIGTDVALMHLHGMAQKLKSKPLQERAQQRLNDIASRRGLTVEELADRLVPDLDLDENGTRVFDFGTRQFQVTFDEMLRPLISDGGGKLLSDLPKPNQKDDAEKAAEAIKEFKAFKKDAKAIATLQIQRLELAMAGQRRWREEQFRQLLLGHPLLIHAVRRLLWANYSEDGELLGTFRVAEDSSLADCNDDVYSAPLSWVGLPHPLELGDCLSDWQRVFGDYEILQPFAQLDRGCHELPEDQRGLLKLPYEDKNEYHAGKVLNLTARGWVKGQALDGGVICEMYRPLANGARIVLELDPGIYAGSIADSESQTLSALKLLDELDGPQPWGSVSAIAYSELMNDLLSLRGK